MNLKVSSSVSPLVCVDTINRYSSSVSAQAEPQKQHDYYKELLANSSKGRNEIVNHELFSSIKNMEGMRIFMENHSFAVYDFMTLLKSLQKRFTCVRPTWTPPKNRIAARLINDIVTGEETDEVVEPHVYISHYELYLDAMKQVGANTSPILALTSTMEQTNDPQKSLEAAREKGATKHALKFVEETFEVSLNEKIPDHVVAAYFLFGREDPIPDMFRTMLDKIPQLYLKKDFVLYLERHIFLDEEHHAPMAKRLLQSLCKDDEKLWQQCAETAAKATYSRARFWDGVLEQVKHL
ncbi:hypothetical protein HELRODRAFT_183213 [Helobdella robusta]|uniref:Heme oxygenase n=1 Tax=Helobdella robusta TaxID=6412 RepID=T1FJB6_HELRO|nr:hypothetical protein HELRODRAFT_183213 [Helobdella robusta]ESO11427.1 hypothetical protein HELRODRAFT_183213 [Helobdella robusta]